MITKAQALVSLRPNAQWSMSNEDITWHDTEQLQPSEADIQAEIARLQAQYDANAYQRKRQAEYPSIGDQLDALWKGGDAQAEMLARVLAVKEKYPKGQA